jgi:hypothetical protein
MAQILDYSAGYPGAINIRRLGFRGGNRYLRKEGTSSVRPLTRAEVLDYQSQGLELALVYQHVSKSRVLEGHDAGRHDAAWALAQARECGVEPRAIYFAVDFDTISPGQWAAVREYMLGAGEIVGLHRVGTYGEYDLLDYLFARGSITWGWQTYAWSTGHNKDNQPRHPRAHLFQRAVTARVGEIDCDVNDVLKPDYGQHPAPQEEIDVATLDDIYARLGVIERRTTSMHAGQYLNIGDKQYSMGGDLTFLDTKVREQVTAALTPVLDQLARIEARPAAELDEAAVAALVTQIVTELEARGVGGVTKTEVDQIVRAAFARAGQPEGSTP